MEPAMRTYLTTMREQAYIDIKAGYLDTGASPKQTKPVYSAYTPPAVKKKKKVERTRFRESTRTFRQKSATAAAPAEQAAAPAETVKSNKKNANSESAAVSMKAGKKEKIRLGQAPTKTLPNAATATKTEDAGAVVQTASATEPANPLETTTKATQKTRYSDRAKVAKKAKTKGQKVDTMAPPAADAAEVADRQTQTSPLGLAGDTSKKKKKPATTGEKTRLTDKNKKPETPAQNSGDAPLAPAQQPAPAAQTPAPSAQSPAPAPQQ
jgi:peptidyl-prolyl cis-trans isomerase SurA